LVSIFSFNISIFNLSKIDQEESKSDESPILVVNNDDEEEKERLRKIKSTKRHISLIERKKSRMKLQQLKFVRFNQRKNSKYHC